LTTSGTSYVSGRAETRGFVRNDLKQFLSCFQPGKRHSRLLPRQVIFGSKSTNRKPKRTGNQ